MIRTVKIDGFDYEKQSYDEFIQDYPLDGWEMEDLGASSDETKHLYGFSMGDVKNKPVIYIHGSIHGSHEWFCAYWVREFARKLHDPSNETPYVRRVIEQLKTNFGFYVIPCLNPWGFDHGDPTNEWQHSPYYRNKNGIPIHSNFGDDNWEIRTGPKGDVPFDQPEADAVRRVWEELNPISMACCHTVGVSTMVAIRPAKVHLINESEKVLRSIPIALNEPNLWDDLWPLLTASPSAYSWAAEQTNSYGIPVMSYALEVGQGYSNFNKAKYGMTGLLLYCMQQSDRMGFTDYGY